MHLENCGIIGFEKLRHIWKGVAHLQNVAHLEKWGTYGIVQDTWKNVAHLEKCAATGKMWRIGKKAAPLEKRNRIGKMCIWKCALQLEI